MTFGPFDEDQRVGRSEYGGSAGLVSYEDSEGPLGVIAGHALTAGEKLGLANRTEGADESGVDPVTGLNAAEVG